MERAGTFARLARAGAGGASDARSRDRSTRQPRECGQRRIRPMSVDPMVSGGGTSAA